MKEAILDILWAVSNVAIIAAAGHYLMTTPPSAPKRPVCIVQVGLEMQSFMGDIGLNGDLICDAAKAWGRSK